MRQPDEDGNPINGLIAGILFSAPLWLIIGAAVYFLEWGW